jgi:HSP20 family protein
VEDATGYTITAEVPGLTKADVKVELLDGTLTIKGERTRPEADASTKTHRTERCYGTLQRSFGLPEDADAQKVSAECKEGLLVVRLPKSEVKKPAQIDVTVN